MPSRPGDEIVHVIDRAFELGLDLVGETTVAEIRREVRAILAPLQPFARLGLPGPKIGGQAVAKGEMRHIHRAIAALEADLRAQVPSWEVTTALTEVERAKEALRGIRWVNEG